MQGQLVQCFVQEKLMETHDILLKDDRLTENFVSTTNNVFGLDDVAELIAGYMDCIEEALCYLKDVERYPDDHPAIVNLREHLAVHRTQFLCRTIKNSSEKIILKARKRSGNLWERLNLPNLIRKKIAMYSGEGSKNNNMSTIIFYRVEREQ